MAVGWVCPRCRAPLRASGRALRCAGCRGCYPVRDGAPDFVGGALTASARRSQREWDAMSEQYRAVLARIPPARFEPIDAPLVQLAAGDVLEVGCGDGRLLAKLAARAGPRLRSLVGVDVAPGMVRLARGRGFEVAVAAAERLPLGDASVDVVVSGYYALRYADLDASLREAARVLRPGGRLGFTLLGRRVPALRGRLGVLPLLAGDGSRWLAAETLLGAAPLALPNDVADAGALRARVAACGFRVDRLVGTAYVPRLTGWLTGLGLTLPYLSGDRWLAWCYDLIVVARRPQLD